MRGQVDAGRRKIESLIASFFTGHHATVDENPRIRFFLYFVLISIVLFFALFLFDLGTIGAFRSLLLVLAGAGQIVSLVALRYCVNPKTAFRISAFVALGYFLFLMGIGGAHGSRIFWILIFPVYAVLLFGDREGLLWTAAGFLGAVYVLFDPNGILSTFPYENETKIRFLIIYGILGVLARVFESTGYRMQIGMVKERTSQLEEAIGRLFTQIEDRKRAEGALLQSEQRFRAFSDASFEGIAFTDGNVFVDLNDQLAQMLGYERPEMIGMPVVSCVAPDNCDLVCMALRSTKCGPHEYMALRKDGSVFPVEMQSGVSEVGGRVVRAMAIRDISDRKQAEAEIRDAKEFAEAVLGSLPGTFYVFDEQLRLTRWNRNFEEVTGYTADELRGKHALDFIVEKDREATVKKIEEALAYGTASLEANTLTKADVSIPYLFNALWCTLGERRYLLGTGLDISDRKRAEERLRRSVELIRSAFETAPDALTITTLESGIFVGVSPSFADVFGFSVDEAIGKSSLDLNIWADVHVRDEIVQCLAAKGFVRNVEVRFRRKDGVLISGLFSGNTLILDGESFILSVVKEITDLKRAEEERLNLERQVQHAQKLESLGVLAGGIAHDFNNILTSVLGNADLGLMRISPMAPARTNLEEIKKGALRAAGLANQMLAYSGKGKFELRFVDLSRLVREMAQLLDVSISKKARLTYDLADDLPLIEVDVNQIQQIVMNLITNASESLGQESGVISLSTASMFCDRRYLDTVSQELQSIYEEPLPEGVYVSLEVSDTGCGMDLETRRKVFDPFFTTKFSGRGLGMAAVRGIVCGHKGGVKIYSEIGKGTTFKVLLPATMDPVMSRTQNSGDDHLHQVWHKEVILVVDDESTIRDIAKEMLEEIGLSVLTASDGNQALEVFKENADKISCVLLDLTMPGLDGTQVFHEMRIVRPEVKVILSSGYNEQDATQRFLDKGLAGFIQKPYSMDKLTEKLNEVLRGG
jgi:PAS domain S-box-containing protein